MMPIDGTLVLMLFTTLAGFSIGIRVERDRCARIADKYEGEWHSDTADACARAIAAAIRSGK